MLKANASLFPAEIETIPECSVTQIDVAGSYEDHATNDRCSSTHGTHHGA